MAYIRVINRLTGKTGMLPEENFDPQKYAPVGQGEEKGGFLKSLAQPFVNTGERVGGATESVLRAFLANKAEKALMKGDYESAMKYGEMGAKPSKLTEDEDYRKKLTDPLQITKDSAAMLSWGVPVKGATSIAGKTINASPNILKAGAVPGVMGGFGYSDEEDLGGLAKDTAVGGATGAVTAKLLNVLFPGKKIPVTGATDDVAMQSADDLAKATPELNRLQKSGYTLKKGAIRPQAGGGPQAVLEENKMVDYLRNKKISGTPENMRYAVAKDYQNLYKQIGDELANNPSKMYKADTVKNWIRNRVTNDGFFYNKANPEYISKLEQELAKITTKSGEVDANVLKNLIDKYNRQLANAYTKAGNNVAPNATEQAMLDINRALHDVFTDISPANIKPMTQDMSMLYKLEGGLRAASLDNPNLFGMSFPIGNPVYGAINTAGDATLALGDALAGKGKFGLPQVPAGGGTIGSKLPAGAAAYSAMDKEQPGTGFTPPSTTTKKETTGPLLSKDQIQQLAVADFMKTGGKNISKINALASLLELDKESEKTGSMDDVVTRNTEQALQLLDSGSVNTGAIGGPLESLKAKVSMGDPETYMYNVLISNIYAAFAKERGGTAFTKQEKELLNQYLPTVGDSRQEARTKLMLLNRDADQLLNVFRQSGSMGQ